MHKYFKLSGLSFKKIDIIINFLYKNGYKKWLYILYKPLQEQVYPSNRPKQIKFN